MAVPTAQDFVQDLKAQIRRSGKSHADYPLVQGIAAGTIPPRQLQGWITQDYVYRRHVPRLAMLRYLKCTDPEIAAHLYEVVEEETAGTSTRTAGHVELFFDLAAGLGVSREQLETAAVLPGAAAHVCWAELILHTQPWFVAMAAQLAGSPTDVIVLSYPKMTPVQLLGRLARGIELEDAPRARVALIEAIGVRLADLHRNARRPVLVVDEAQLASPSLLEEIRLLTNFEDRQDKHLHVVLLGQPELRERIRKRRQIDQRVSLRFHVEPMERNDVRGYLEHRLSAAGGDAARVFSSEAVDALAERSGGVPRRLNTLATQSLFVGAMRAIHQIDAEHGSLTEVIVRRYLVTPELQAQGRAIVQRKIELLWDMWGSYQYY